MSTTKKEAPAAVAEKAGFTDYTVMHVTTAVGPENASNTSYQEIGTVLARSAKDAIRAKKNGDGRYVAVPTRSLKPVTVTTEKVEKVSLS